MTPSIARQESSTSLWCHRMVALCLGHLIADPLDLLVDHKVVVQETPLVEDLPVLKEIDLSAVSRILSSYNFELRSCPTVCLRETSPCHLR